MVKRQKEKQYLSAREQRDYQSVRAGGSSSLLASSLGSSQPHLPFFYCALTLQPFQSPVCNNQGILFDKDALAGFVFKYKRDPVTGQPMSTRDVIVLNMAKDEETGAWQCPILQKNFGDHIKVVAIRQNDPENTANVYSFEAYHELNVKGQNYFDLISGRPFDKSKHVLVLNDPQNDTFNQQRDITQFYHIKHERELHRDEGDKNGDIQHSTTATRVLEKLKKKQSSDEREGESNNKRLKTSATAKIIEQDDLDGIVLAQDVTGVAYNTAQGAASLTSTGVTLAKDAQARPATQEEILQAEFRVMTSALKGRKGYVQMNLRIHGKKNDTPPNKGDTNSSNIMTLTLELHCDIAPRTCANFLGLSVQGEYDGCGFHRLIPKFMIQGGSKASKKSEKKEDESLWGGPFVDEFDDRLTHTGPGVLSMANSGPGTNTRQFFITFASCRHLDRKHSVFGKVIQGLEHLSTLEAVPTDNKDVPSQLITIVSVDVLENPAQMAHDMERKRLQEILAARQRASAPQPHRAKPSTAPPETNGATNNNNNDPGIGRYLKNRLTGKLDGESNTNVIHRLPPPPKSTNFKDFGGW